MYAESDANEQSVIFDLNRYAREGPSGLEAAISNLNLESDPFPVYRSTLELVRKRIYSAEHGDRSWVPNMAIFLLDATLFDESVFEQEASTLEQEGGVVIVPVGVQMTRSD